MALIYANAVNKRMNNPSLKPKKKNTRPCSVLDDSSVASAYEGQARKVSREGTVTRKSSCNTPSGIQLVIPENPSESRIAIRSRPRSLHRSKTSCYELAERDGEEVLRKMSHPVIYHSASQPLNRKSNEERRAEARKTLIQKYNLEHGYDESLPHCEDRRRSVSLGPDQWRDRIGTAAEKQKKDGAFQKMKRKLSKWKLGGRTE